MRKTMLGIAAVLAAGLGGAGLGVAPAMACGGYGCAQPVYSPCSPCGGPVYNRLTAPEPQFHVAAPRYYYVDQGPTYSGPAAFAPAPTYQERAVSGWSVYDRPYYYGYTGGPYADPTNHYYDGMPYSRGPAIYSYRARPAHYGVRRVARYGWAPRYHRVHRVHRAYAPYRHAAVRPSVRYGYTPHRGYAPRFAPAPRHGYAPHHGYAPRYAPGPRFAPGPRYGHGPRAGFAPQMRPQAGPGPHPHMQHRHHR